MVTKDGISGGPSATPNEEHGKLPTFVRLPETQSAFCIHCGCWRGCLGLEPTPSCRSGDCGACFVCHIVEVFREVKRVLRADGCLWLNMGDSYAGTKEGNTNGGASSGLRNDGRPEDGRQRSNAIQAENMGAMAFRKVTPSGILPKNLLLMPHRCALALQADGWIVRMDVVWAKLNPMPESCQDRPTRSHEYVFLLTQQPRYFYDAEAVREKTGNECSEEEYAAALGCDWSNKAQDAEEGRGHFTLPDGSKSGQRGVKRGAPSLTNPAGRNMRSVLFLSTQPFAEAHFATFPERLVEPLLKCSTSEYGVCGGCGAPWRRVVERKTRPNENDNNGKHDGTLYRTVSGGVWNDASPRVVLGWEPTCTCAREDVVPATVLDCFGGSGTTGVVAARLGRRAILIDQNPDYLALARKRIDAEPTRLFAVPGEARPKGQATGDRRQATDPNPRLSPVACRLPFEEEA